MATRINRRKQLLGVLAGVIGLATIAGYFIFPVFFDAAPIQTDQQRDSNTTQPPAAVLAAPLGNLGEEIDQLAKLGRTDQTFHAVYTVDDPGLQGLVQTVETWRKDDRYRNDQFTQASDGSPRLSYVDDRQAYRYCETADGTQTCPDSVSKTAPRTPDVAKLIPPDLALTFIFKATSATPKTVLHASDEDIAGYQARCFQADGVGELCFTTDGVVLKLVLIDPTQGAVTVTAKSVDPEVPDSAFQLTATAR